MTGLLSLGYKFIWVCTLLIIVCVLCQCYIKDGQICSMEDAETKNICLPCKWANLDWNSFKTFGATLPVPYHVNGCRNTVLYLAAVHNVAWVVLLETALWFLLYLFTITYETEELQEVWDMRKLYFYHMHSCNFFISGHHEQCVTAQQPQLPRWYDLFEKGLLNHLQMNLLKIWYCRLLCTTVFSLRFVHS